MRFSVTPGVASLIAGAACGANDRVQFLLDGDLSQMSEQEEFLRSRGFKVGRTDVYPGLYTEEEFRSALDLIWKHRVSGWWHYKEKYVKYSICSQEEFMAALNVECAKERSST